MKVEIPILEGCTGRLTRNDELFLSIRGRGQIYGAIGRGSYSGIRGFLGALPRCCCRRGGLRVFLVVRVESCSATLTCLRTFLPCVSG